MRYLFILCVFLFGGLQSCGIFDGSDATTSSVFFERPTLNTTFGQGGDEHRIKDLWITLGNQDLGVWPIEVEVPLLPVNDPELLTVNAGVRNNGSLVSSIIYPFYEGIILERSFLEGVTDTLALEFEYSENTVFSFVEDFEGNHLFTNDEDDDPESIVEIVEENGSKIAKLSVMPDHEIVDVSTSLSYSDIVSTTNSVFLEMEYKGETTFLVSIVGVNGSGNETLIPFFIAKETSEWNKLYLNLTPELDLQDAVSYRIRFTVQSSTAAAEETVYIDNVKLVHF